MIVRIFPMISKVQVVKSSFDNHPTVRYLQRKLNMESLRYNKLSECDDEWDEHSESQPQQGRGIRAKNVTFIGRGFSYSNIPNCEENSKPNAATTTPVQTTTKPDQQPTSAMKQAQQDKKRKEATVQSSGPFQNCGKLSFDENSNSSVLTVTGKKRDQQSALEIAHRPLCQMPSWNDNRKAKEKLGVRRSAVCDNIERQLLNNKGISLRKLRKFLVVDNILHEVNLL